MMLKVLGRQTSSNVQALTWCLQELGQEYEREDRGHIHGGLDTAEFRGLNPHGRIPVLLHDDHPPLWETGAILRYLADRFANDEFWPKDPVRRAGVDKWAEWAKNAIALNFTAPVFWPVVRTAPCQRVWGDIRAAVQEFESQLASAEARLSDCDFLAGPVFTLADIQFGHVLYRYFEIEIEREDFPQVRAYYDRLCLRAPYQTTVMVPYEELRETK